MIYNNRHYPHPVLGIGDDMAGDVQVKLKVSSDSEHIVIENTFSVDNKDLKRLIKENKACYSIHMSCAGTFFRSNYSSYKELSDPIKIKSSDLNGEVEINYFICANKDIVDYTNDASNADYGETQFRINKGDILAYIGKGKFYANKTYQETTSISSIMNVNTDGKSNHPFFLDYGDEKITITLCKEDYEIYQEIKLKKFASILHSSLVLPALQQAISFIESGEADEQRNTPWFEILNDFILKEGDTDAMVKAQKILDLPLNRSFRSMRDLQQTY